MVKVKILLVGGDESVHRWHMIHGFERAYYRSRLVGRVPYKKGGP